MTKKRATTVNKPIQHPTMKEYIDAMVQAEREERIERIWKWIGYIAIAYVIVYFTFIY